MKTNFESNSLDKSKPIHNHSVIYPSGGYVAMPENKPSRFKQKKSSKKIKGHSAGIDYAAKEEQIQ